MTQRRTTRSRDEFTPVIDRKQAAVTGASSVSRYLFDIFSLALRLLRKPLGILLFIWSLGILFTWMAQTFRMVFSPVCIIPGISSSALCQRIMPIIDNCPKWANFTQLAEIQGATFEQLLDESVIGSGLSFEIKKAEMATSDLVTLVHHSDLVSRELLAKSLGDFVDNVRKTGRGLHKLSSKIGGAVDSVMAVNNLAIRAIEAANDKSSSGLLNIWPFAPSATSAETRAIIRQTFTDCMDVLANQIHRVVLEAEVDLVNLERLEEHLRTIYEVITHENNTISAEYDELLASLWTLLGGNKRKLKGHQQHLVLLKGLGAYRRRALAYVTVALQTLRALSADMEELRERVAAPDILGDRVLVEVHMHAIRAGLDRLKKGQMKAREREREIFRGILGSDAPALNE
ncbi:uncharacterized protein LAESUDRAFT_660682 [Laetiporus sulphureus 93-53]|uniref:Uncharacterized protein n=1 Tax=Laetiporus sulphureus 93-53 TaxID=1314785 RepID=A0A165CK45_9APHY|nr:uncharacterized protein LAESUDRAFT_660682 [Laetiporus sulphureus 93-53]KZT02957.1 hypothetical protein LAESUDRAFT_660682 [Laetiporus sulphureus 93-53]